MATATVNAIEEEVFKARRRLTVETARRMADAEVLGFEPRDYELIKGVIVERMPEGTEHSQSCILIDDLLHQVVPRGYFVAMAHPLVVNGDDSAPVPDGMIVRGHVRDYAGRDFAPANVALVVEVSSTSLPRDRGWKKDLYAEMGVPVYWIVNLVDQVLEVYRDPSPPGAGQPARYLIAEPPRTASERASLILDGTNIHDFDVRELLP